MAQPQDTHNSKVNIPIALKQSGVGVYLGSEIADVKRDQIAAFTRLVKAEGCNLSDISQTVKGQTELTVQAVASRQLVFPLSPLSRTPKIDSPTPSKLAFYLRIIHQGLQGFTINADDGDAGTVGSGGNVNTGTSGSGPKKGRSVMQHLQSSRLLLDPVVVLSPLNLQLYQPVSTRIREPLSIVRDMQ